MYAKLCIVLLLFASSLAHAQQRPPLPKSLGYVLQAEGIGKSRAEAVSKLAQCGRDWLVLDAAYSGKTGGRWTRQNVAKIRAGKPNRKVIAYFSVGEAEDYRSYWRRAWDTDKDGTPDKSAPSFLTQENPDWKGNYKVRYWQETWQQIILAELDKIVVQGFDGVYLDIVDGFEYFEYDPKSQRYVENRLNPETKRTFRADMMIWIQRIAAHARKTQPDFLVIPQNGTQLLETGDYREIIDGIGVEDLFTDGNTFQSDAHIAYQLAFLAKLKPLKKPIFVIEYSTKADARQRSIAKAKANSLLLLLTDRPLKTLGTTFR